MRIVLALAVASLACGSDSPTAPATVITTTTTTTTTTTLPPESITVAAAPSGDVRVDSAGRPLDGANYTFEVTYNSTLSGGNLAVEFLVASGATCALGASSGVNLAPRVPTRITLNTLQFFRLNCLLPQNTTQIRVTVLSSGATVLLRTMDRPQRWISG